MRPVGDAFPGSVPELPSTLADTGADGFSWAGSPILSLLVVACVLTGLLLLKNVLHAVPAVLSAFARIRGSQDIEGSVRLSRDRNLTALLLVIPFTMLLSRFRIYDPGWMAGFSPEWHLLWTFVCLMAYLLVHSLMALWLRSRRVDSDVYTMARRFCWSAFIILMLLLLPLTGILLVCGANDLTIKWILTDVIFVVFALFCFRKGQIFGLSCKPFTTFLYLCALEFLPLALLIASAVVEI